MPLPQPHKMGSKPIYLWHHCHSCSSVNTHIESNEIHLLWQKIAAAATPCERTFKPTHVTLSVWNTTFRTRAANKRYIHSITILFSQYWPVVTARKRSLGQGNMFTGVCLFTRGVPAPGGRLLQGVSALEGFGLGGAWWRPPRRLLLGMVSILLECILVDWLIVYFSFGTCT